MITKFKTLSQLAQLDNVSDFFDYVHWNFNCREDYWNKLSWAELLEEKEEIKVDELEIDSYGHLLDGNDLRDLTDWDHRISLLKSWQALDTWELSDWDQSRTDRALGFRLDAFDVMETQIRCNPYSRKYWNTKTQYWSTDIKSLYRNLAAEIVSKDHPNTWMAGVPCKPGKEIWYLPKKDLVCLINLCSEAIHEEYDTKGYKTWKHYEEEEPTS